MFVSIHANAFKNRKVRGASVYTLSERGASSEAAKWLATRENAADLVGGIKLREKDDILAKVLLELSQTATQEASQEAATHVLKNLNKLGRMHPNEPVWFLTSPAPNHIVYLRWITHSGWLSISQTRY